MRLWNVILLFICFNGAAIFIGQLVAADVLMLETKDAPYSMVSLQNVFDYRTIFSAQNIGTGMLAGGIGAIIMLVTRQGTYALYVILIFLIGTFIPIFSWIINGFGNIINIFLAGTGLETLGYIVTAVFYAFFFFQIAGILSQRGDFTEG